MNSMLNGLRNATNYTMTENGAITHKTTESALLDMFAMGGAMRERSVGDVTLMFKKAYQEMCEHFLTLRHFGFSVVADGNEPMTARWVGLGLADADGGAWYVPIAAAAGSGAAESAAVVAAVGRVLAGDAMKVSHDVKFALTLLRRHGIDMQGPWFDTMLAHYVVQPELSHGIEYLTQIYLHRHLPTPDDICGGKGRTRCSMADVPAAEMGVVGAGRADSALRIEEPLRQAMAESGVAPPRGHTGRRDLRPGGPRLHHHLATAGGGGAL